MSAFRAASLQGQRTALALLLCFLAISFAMEARMSRYEMREEAGNDVHASRVIPPEMRDLTPDESSSANSEGLTLFSAFLIALAVDAIFVLERPFSGAAMREAHCILARCCFSPQLAFRPPPTP